MAEPGKADTQAIFKRLRSIQTNKQCFDCGGLNPTWASITYGVFLCIDCSAVHRSLGVHLTFVKSTQLDTNWSYLQVRAMQIGGNANATAFFRQHGCTTTDAQQKYNSRAANMYRERLHTQAMKAVKMHGTQLHIDAHSSGDPKSPTGKEQDFFKEHTTEGSTIPTETIVDAGANLSKSQPVPISNGTVPNENADPGQGPNVDHALSVSPTAAVQHAEPRKATIGQRKTAAKKGLGVKKGLGAQRVKTNFNELETAAQQRDKDKELMAKHMAAQEAKMKEDEEKKMASMRLAYQDLSIERKKQDEKMKNMDPKKKEQAQRLGMGMGSGSVRGGVSHSAMTDMKTIQQEAPSRSYDREYERNNDRFSSRSRGFDDDFEFVGGPPNRKTEYSDSPFGLKESYSSGWGSNSKSSWDKERDLDRFDSKQSKFIDETIPSKTKDDDRGRSRKTYEVSSSEEAQKKFGNAKAISSDMYFGGKEMDFETRSNLQKYEGSSSISSADLFGESGTRRPQYSSGPDLDDIKDSVKQGVTKVAGKLSSLANGVISSIQRKQ